MNKELTDSRGPGKPSGVGKLGGLILGSHLSVAGGLERALTEAVALGCDCVQIFVKNQRQWRAAPLSEEQIARFRAAQCATQVAPVVAHASYLLNLASPDEPARQRSIDALTDELQRCEALGVAYLVFHPGAHLNDDERIQYRDSPSRKRKRADNQNRDRQGAGDQYRERKRAVDQSVERKRLDPQYHDRQGASHPRLRRPSTSRSK